MAQSHKFKSLEDLTAYFPDVPWKASDTKVWVYDAKAEEYVEVTKGDFVVSIGDRYEVTDTEPEKAKPAEKAETKKSEDKPNASVETESIESGVATKTNE